jgi:hypothetical protein
MARIVPLTGGEKESLVAALDRHRDVILWKLRGLDDEQLRRPMTPSGLTMLGVTKHLAWVDAGWFCDTFGLRTDLPGFDPDDPEADMRVEPDETTADIVGLFEHARALADASIAAHDLDDTGHAWFGEPVSMRWVLVHMVEEYARHAGHLDIMRELLDGATGDHDRSTG